MLSMASASFLKNSPAASCFLCVFIDVLPSYASWEFACWGFIILTGNRFREYNTLQSNIYLASIPYHLKWPLNNLEINLGAESVTLS